MDDERTMSVLAHFGIFCLEEEINERRVFRCKACGEQYGMDCEIETLKSHLHRGCPPIVIDMQQKALPVFCEGEGTAKIRNDIAQKQRSTKLKNKTSKWRTWLGSKFVRESRSCSAESHLSVCHTQCGVRYHEFPSSNMSPCCNGSCGHPPHHTDLAFMACSFPDSQRPPRSMGPGPAALPFPHSLPDSPAELPTSTLMPCVELDAPLSNTIEEFYCPVGYESVCESVLESVLFRDPVPLKPESRSFSQSSSSRDNHSLDNEIETLRRLSGPPSKSSSGCWPDAGQPFHTFTQALSETAAPLSQLITGDSFSHLDTHDGEFDEGRFLQMLDSWKQSIPSPISPILLHVEESAEFHCPECDVTFNRKDNLQAHRKKYHTNISPTLSRISPRLSRISPTLSRTSPILSPRRNQDLPIIHVEESAKFHCPECDVTFERKDNLQAHWKKYHTDISPTLSPRKNQDPPIIHVEKSAKFHCPECVVTFERKDNLQAHWKKFHTNISPTLSPRKNQDPPIIHVEKSAEFHCPECDMTFNRKDNLQAHRKKFHTNISPTLSPKRNQDPPTIHVEESAEFHCPECDVTFNRKDNLQAHLKKYHTDISPTLSPKWSQDPSTKSPCTDSRVRTQGSVRRSSILPISPFSSVSSFQSYDLSTVSSSRSSTQDLIEDAVHSDHDEWLQGLLDKMLHHERHHDEQLHHEQLHHEQLHHEQLHHEQLHHEKFHDKQLHDEQLHDEQLHDEQHHDEQLHHEKFHDKQLHDEQFHDEQLHHEQLHHERLEIVPAGSCLKIDCTSDANEKLSLKLESFLLMEPSPNRKFRRIFEARGEINGIKASALPDTGATENTMSASFARRHFASSIESSETCREFQIGSGKFVKTNTTVRAMWTFEDEPSNEYDLVFHIIEDAPQAITLCQPFLQSTETLTTYKKRIRETLVRRAGVRYVNVVGPARQRVLGMLNGMQTAAFPDTGCEPHLMSLDFAVGQKLYIESHKDNGLLQFADGSIIPSLGEVHCTWSFGDDRIKTYDVTFEVVDGCPFDVIIGQELLYNTNAYTVYQRSFVDDLSDETCHSLCGVTWLPSFLEQFLKRSGAIKRKAAKSAGKLPTFLKRVGAIKKKSARRTVKTSTIPEVDHELERRIRSEKAIESITDTGERQVALDREKVQQSLWGFFKESESLKPGIESQSASESAVAAVPLSGGHLADFRATSNPLDPSDPASNAIHSSFISSGREVIPGEHLPIQTGLEPD